MESSASRSELFEVTYAPNFRGVTSPTVLQP
jgi:hypothetical protein